MLRNKHALLFVHHKPHETNAVWNKDNVEVVVHWEIYQQTNILCGELP